MKIKYLLFCLILISISIIGNANDYIINGYVGTYRSGPYTDIRTNCSPCIDSGAFISTYKTNNYNELPKSDDMMAYDISGTPRWGKWPGDRPDIGAYEWLPIELQTPNRTWNGKVLTYNPITNPRLKSPTKIRVKSI